MSFVQTDFGGSIHMIPKNFGFKTIPVESRDRTGNGTQFNLDKHIKDARRDFAELEKESKDANINKET